jgi:citrate lyase subunit beta / citryl-CoA lyase
MSNVHPNTALFAGEKPFPVIPSCEHFAGSEKLILKALALQDEYGPIFDITCDCEDGAPAGQEKAHAEMIVRVLTSDANKHKQAGARIHDFTHPHWREDVDILVSGAGQVLRYITIPKCTSFDDAHEMIRHIHAVSNKNNNGRTIPIHILIETHGALRDVALLATLPNVEVLDFGLMDFVSGHHGAIPAAAMRSPGQFEHKLIARAKAEMVAAALANGVVPAHNVCLDLKNADVVRADASRARNEFGFLRMWSIYPAQIQPIVDAMKPDNSEVEDAANILLAAQVVDWGPIQYKGELHDRATYRYFWELLQKAKVTGVKMPDAALTAFF